MAQNDLQVRQQHSASVLNKLSEGKHPEDTIEMILSCLYRGITTNLDQQMEGFSYFMPASSVVYGGNDGILFEQQKKGLTLGGDVVIATPGR